MSYSLPLYFTPVAQIWRPSAVRILALEAAIPTARGTPAQPPLAWPAKDPDDMLDYQLDLAGVLLGVGPSHACGGPGTDAIATLDVSIYPDEPGDLTLASSAADGTRCIVWLRGGQAGTTYIVTFRVGTHAGRVISRSVCLPVLALSNPRNPHNPRDALLTDDGQAITDESGQPILVAQGA